MNNENKNIVAPSETAKKEPPPIDSKVTINVDPAYKSATITVSAPENGGKTLTFEEIIKELETRNITHGVNQSLIKRIISDRMYGSPFQIATYTPPVNGENGSIEYKFEKEFKPKPKISETGVVNFKELGLVQIINTNIVIAEITKPTDGTPGMDIRGKSIPQKKGDKANFSIGQNISITPDGLRLVSAVSGVLKWVRDGFMVESTLTLENVDSSTGNIRFIGDVVVRGDVREGFHVQSDKNITVHGTVSGSKLEAGGTITVKSGCFASKLRAAGNITVNFFENCMITTDADIESSTFTFCTIKCGGSITTKGAGVIVGGQITCLGNICCNVIGSKNFVKTEVIVGNTAVFVKERSEHAEIVKTIKEELLSLTRDIKFLLEKKATLGKLPPDKQSSLDYCMKQRMLKKHECAEKEKKIAEIDALLSIKRYHEIICKTAAYPNVIIRIGQAIQSLTSKYTNVKFTLKEDDNTINIHQ